MHRRASETRRRNIGVFIARSLAAALRIAGDERFDVSRAGYPRHEASGARLDFGLQISADAGGSRARIERIRFHPGLLPVGFIRPAQQARAQVGSDSAKFSMESEHLRPRNRRVVDPYAVVDEQFPHAATGNG
jgi:hypothetical protein